MDQIQINAINAPGVGAGRYVAIPTSKRSAPPACLATSCLRQQPRGSDYLTRVPELRACLRRLLEGENVGLSIAYTAPRTGKYL